jgi:hypothetical protein
MSEYPSKCGECCNHHYYPADKAWLCAVDMTEKLPDNDACGLGAMKTTEQRKATE